MKKRDEEEEEEENADGAEEIMADEDAAGGGMAVEEVGEEEKVDRHEYDLVMPGFRFHPTEEEIIEFYLRRKVEGKPFNVELIFFLDLYRFDPWELPGIDKTQKTGMGIGIVGDKELFFYVPRDRKYRNGDRPNRVTTSGYWKATGADRVIKSELNPRRAIGLKKTLVFYSGKAPKGVRTTWIMNEYRLPHLLVQKLKKPEISLCRVYNRSEVGDRHYHYQYNSRLSTTSSRSKTKSKDNTRVESSHESIVTRQLLHIDPLPPPPPLQAPSDTADHQSAMEFEILLPTTTTCVADDINMEYMGSDHHNHHQDTKYYLHKSTDRFSFPAASSPSSMVQNSSQKCMSDWNPIADHNVSIEYFYHD